MPVQVPAALFLHNEKDIKEIDGEFLKGVRFHYVKTMQQVLELALV